MTENPATDDERLAAVQDRIDDAKAAEADLHGRDVLGDTGDRQGGGAEEHGAFEPSGDGTDAGRNPVEGEAADTPGEAGDAEGVEHRDEPKSVEQFDGPGPNPA